MFSSQSTINAREGQLSSLMELNGDMAPCVTAKSPHEYNVALRAPTHDYSVWEGQAGHQFRGDDPYS